MQFLVYIAVVVVGVSTILLEINWLTSPSPVNTPQTRVAGTAVHPSSTVKTITKTAGANVAASPASPNNPATPRVVGATVNVTPSAEPAAGAPPAAGSAASTPVPLPSVSATASTSAATETTGAAPQSNSAITTASSAPILERAIDTAATAAPADQPAAAPPPAAQTVQQQTQNRCDIQACSSAYRSFRAADCTYQPYEGARRLCAIEPGASRRLASQPSGPNIDSGSRARKDDEALRDAVRRVKKLTEFEQMDIGRGPSGFDSGVIVIRRNGARW